MTMKKTATRVAAKTLGIIGGAMTGGIAGAIGTSSSNAYAEQAKHSHIEVKNVPESADLTGLAGEVVGNVVGHLRKKVLTHDTDIAATQQAISDGLVHGGINGSIAGAALGTTLAVGVPMAVNAVRGYRAARANHMADGAAKARK